jgi:hypothetical protein
MNIHISFDEKPNNDVFSSSRLEFLRLRCKFAVMYISAQFSIHCTFCLFIFSEISTMYFTLMAVNRSSLFRRQYCIYALDEKSNLQQQKKEKTILCWETLDFSAFYNVKFITAWSALYNILYTLFPQLHQGNWNSNNFPFSLYCKRRVCLHL